jgi:hypothetical protein
MPENPRSDDTEITLREHIEARLDSLERHMNARFDAAQQAVEKAERTMNERLQGMNEFRDTLRDQATRFATVAQLDEKLAPVAKLEERLRDVERAAVPREMVEDLRTRMEHAATRVELEVMQRGRESRFAAAEERVNKLESFQSNLQGRMWAMGALIFFGALIINLVLRFLFQARGT